MVFWTVYELEASENKTEVPFDKEEVSVCILVCIIGNARVPVILPDWHNYGWDV